MKRLYLGLLEDIKAGNFKLLPEVHATSSGLKAFCTWITSDGIEECRKACGGHGYSLSSGLPTLFTNYVPACTYEGDNYVLIQQTARYLLKAVKDVLHGKQPVGSVKYLENATKNKDKCTVQIKAEFLHPDVQLAAYRHRAIRLIVDVAKQMETEMHSGKSYEAAWNTVMPDFLRVAKAHCFYVMVESFQRGVNEIGDENIKSVLKRLSDLFALYYMEKDLVDFIEDGYMTQQQGEFVRQQIRILLDQIRPDAIPLVDSFNFSDMFLNSALGRYDGKCYEALYDWAQGSELNKSQVVDGYEEYLKPLIDQRSRL